MELIRRFESGDPYTIVRPLSPADRHALVEHTERGDNLLAEAWNNNWWITCDCNQKHKTIMTVRKTEIGTFHLVTLKRRGLHLPDCQFHRDEVVQQRTGSVDERVEATFVCFHRDAVHSTESQDEDDGGGSASTSAKPRLYRFLLTLIESAGLNVFNPSKQPTVAEQFQELVTEAGRLYLAPNVPLSRFFWTHPGAYARSCVTLKESTSLFKSPIRPQGLHCWLALKASGKKIVCPGDLEFEVQSAIVKSGRHGEADSPWLVLSTLSHGLDNPSWYELQKGVAILVASRSVLMPVDSRYEQAVALAGFRYCRWMMEAHKKKVVMEKPVFAFPGDGTIKPDFVFRSAGKTVFVEVMGSREVDYLERKKVLIPKLESLGEVVELDALTAESEGRLDEAVQHCLKRVAAKLLS